MDPPIHDFSLSKQFSASREIFCLKFHPSEQILLMGDVEGSIHFGLFDTESKSMSLPEGMDTKPYIPHKSGSTRSIDFFGKDVQIVSGGSDGRVVLSNFDPVKIGGWKIGTPISSVKSVSESLILAGDDDGAIHGIDMRVRKKVFTVAEQTDFITSIEVGSSLSPLKTIIATSGDSTLAVYDLRGKAADRLVAMSDEQQNELNHAIVMNGESHVLTGDAGGVVGIWKQGFWGDLKDRLPLYADSSREGAHAIEGMKKISEDKFLTATADGIIRYCSLFPNEVEYVVGVHRSDEGKEVGTISGFDCDVDMGLVATACGDPSGTVKFWELNRTVEAETTKKAKKSGNFNPEKANRQTFFQEL
jgi:WD40 repeat protein